MVKRTAARVRTRLILLARFWRVLSISATVCNRYGAEVIIVIPNSHKKKSDSCSCHANYHSFCAIFKQKSYFIRQTRPKTARHFFRIRVIFLLASRLLASTTLIYRWVVVILLCAMMLWMVRMSVPAAACSVAKVLR